MRLYVKGSWHCITTFETLQLKDYSGKMFPLSGWPFLYFLCFLCLTSLSCSLYYSCYVCFHKSDCKIQLREINARCQSHGVDIQYSWFRHSARPLEVQHNMSLYHRSRSDLSMVVWCSNSAVFMHGTAIVAFHVMFQASVPAFRLYFFVLFHNRPDISWNKWTFPDRLSWSQMKTAVLCVILLGTKRSLCCDMWCCLLVHRSHLLSVPVTLLTFSLFKLEWLVSGDLPDDSVAETFEFWRFSLLITGVFSPCCEYVFGLRLS